MSWWRAFLAKLFGSSVSAVTTPGTVQDKEAAVVQTVVEAGLEAAVHGIEQATTPKTNPTVKTPEEKAAAKQAKQDKKASTTAN